MVKGNDKVCNLGLPGLNACDLANTSGLTWRFNIALILWFLGYSSKFSRSSSCTWRKPYIICRLHLQETIGPYNVTSQAVRWPFRVSIAVSFRPPLKPITGNMVALVLSQLSKYTSSTPTKQHNKIFEQNWNTLPYIYIYITSNHKKSTTSHNSVTQPLFYSQKRCAHNPSPAGLWVLFSSLLLGPSIPGVALTKGGWMKPAASFCQTGRAGGWILGCFKFFSSLIVEKSQSGGIWHEKQSQEMRRKGQTHGGGY